MSPKYTALAVIENGLDKGRRYRAVLSGVHMLASGDRTAWLTMQSAANLSPQQIPC